MGNTVHYAGLVVLTRPDRIAACTEQLSGLGGVEVHHVDPSQGRIVVVQETTTVEAQRAGLFQIQALAAVEVAELVYHYVDEPSPAEAALEGELRASDSRRDR